jgi:hypothetical protein
LHSLLCGEEMAFTIFTPAQFLGFLEFVIGVCVVVVVREI